MYIDANEMRRIVRDGRGEKRMTVYAAELGVSTQYLGKVLSGDAVPGPTIAKAMGYEQVIAYRMAPFTKDNIKYALKQLRGVGIKPVKNAKVKNAKR